MFDIDNKYNIANFDFAVISDSYKVFLFDEFPILFTGINYLKNKIIGSLSCEDEDADIFRYLHFLVSNKQYFDFVKRKITYRELILSIPTVFVLDKDINDNVLVAYNIPTDAIPDEYLPYEGIYCPNTERVIGFDFTFSLQGGLADLHEAYSDTIASIGKSADNVFSKLGASINIKQFKPKVLQLAHSDGSFKLNFRIKADTHALFYKEAPIHKYFQDCLEYSLDSLVGEGAKLASGDFSGTKFESKIVPSLINVYESFSYKFEEQYIQVAASKLVDSIDDIEDIGDQIGNGFTGIEVLGFDSSNEETSVGFIDETIVEEIAILNEGLSNSSNTNELVDNDYQSYRIQVYDLNTDSRKGTAHINNSDDILDNPKIHIQGEEDLAESVFTERTCLKMLEHSVNVG